MLIDRLPILSALGKQLRAGWREDQRQTGTNARDGLALRKGALPVGHTRRARALPRGTVGDEDVAILGGGVSARTEAGLPTDEHRSDTHATNDAIWEVTW